MLAYLLISISETDFVSSFYSICVVISKTKMAFTLKPSQNLNRVKFMIIGKRFFQTTVKIMQAFVLKDRVLLECEQKTLCKNN